MKKQQAIKELMRQSLRRREAAKRQLAAERARIKLPYKPEHVTQEQIREAVASLRG